MLLDISQLLVNEPQSCKGLPSSWSHPLSGSCHSEERAEAASWAVLIYWTFRSWTSLQQLTPSADQAKHKVQCRVPIVWLCSVCSVALCRQLKISGNLGVISPCWEITSSYLTAVGVFAHSFKRLSMLSIKTLKNHWVQEGYGRVWSAKAAADSLTAFLSKDCKTDTQTK